MQATTQQCVRVVVLTSDVLSYAGVAGYLGAQPELTLIEPRKRDEADVIVFVPGELTPDTWSSLGTQATPVVLVANQVSDADLETAVDRGVRAVLPRSLATSDQLLHSVLATQRENQAADLLQHQNTNPDTGPAGLNPREIDVLRLMAEGLDTAEIANTLFYSERTVKNMIYRFTTRLRLRNRPHAVAYAMRAGVI